MAFWAIFRLSPGTGSCWAVLPSQPHSPWVQASISPVRTSHLQIRSGSNSSRRRSCLGASERARVPPCRRARLLPQQSRRVPSHRNRAPQLQRFRKRVSTSPRRLGQSTISRTARLPSALKRKIKYGSRRSRQLKLLAISRRQIVKGYRKPPDCSGGSCREDRSWILDSNRS